MDEIAEQALNRVRLEQDYRLEHETAQAITAARALGDDLDELEALAAQLLTIRNRVRVKARSLHTSREVGEAQTSEAELVAAPLRRQIVDLKEHLSTAEQELATFRRHHMCTESCRPNAHVAFTGKSLVKELEEANRQAQETIMAQRARIAELENQVPSEIVTMPAECLSAGRLTRQLDVALSQVSALQRRKDELAARISDMSGWLDLKTSELASANEQRDQAREQERRVRAAWQTEIERGRDLEADISRLREELPRRYTLAQVMDQRAEAREELMREYESVSVDLLRRALEALSLTDAELILEITNHLGKVRTAPLGE